MKVAVLADIHGNLPALEAVTADILAWRPDQVIVAGDIVNRGPRPLACWDSILDQCASHGWLLVRGNHEDYVLDQAQPGAPRQGPEFDIAQNGFWTCQRLNGRVGELADLPFQVSLNGPDGSEVRCVHASMLSNRSGIYLHTADAELRQKISPAPQVLCVGHTHRPLIRQIDQTLVVNVGSVGMPFDGDRRAAYARLTWRDQRWQAELVRLSYDQDQTERDFFTTDFIPGAGDLARIMLVEFRQACSHIHRWAYQYEAAVLAGQLSLTESVQAYLAEHGLADLV